MELDPRQLRRCLGRFTTGVTVVTYRTPEGFRGATINAFMSVSLDPALILVSLSRKATACSAMQDVPFAVNVLRSDQVDVALQFAGQPRPGAVINWRDGDGDKAPSLANAVAVLNCRPWRRYDGGDHVLHLGEVSAIQTGPGEPLVFSDGRFTTTGLPVLDGPMVVSPLEPPTPAWVGAAHRLHHRAEAC